MAGIYQITPTSVFSPTQIPGCVVWLDAADSSSMTMFGSQVSQWNNKSGNQCNVTQATPANQPILRSNYLNGQSVMFFTPNQFIGGNIPSTNSYTRFLVYSNSVVNVGAAVNDGAGFLQNGGGTTYQSALGFTNAITFQTGSTFRMSEEYKAASGAGIDGATWINGTSLTLQFYEAARSYSDTSIALGRRGDGIYFTGAVAEVVLYNGPITTAQRQLVEGYLASKWGLQGNLPANHPYKTTMFTYSFPFPAVISPSILTVPGPRFATNDPVFLPTQISGCQLWLDAADTSTVVTSGSTITQWRDKSGTNKTTTFVNTNTYTTGVSVNTSGSSSAFFRVNIDFRKTVAPYVNMFIVHTWSGSGLGTQQALWGQDDGGGFNRIQFLSVPSDALAAYALYYSSISPFRFSYPPLNTGSRVLYSVNLAYLISNSTFVGVNGTNSSTVTEGAASPQTSTQSLGFASQNTTGGSIGTLNFHEIITYVSSSSNISLAQQQQVEGYLAWKWGLVSSLPNGHPYKTPPIAPFPYAVRQSTQVKFSPLNITGCQMWLDAQDSSTILLSGSSVTQWTNKTGGTSLTQTTPANRPTLTTNAGKPMILFNNTWLFSLSFPFNWLNSSLFIVFQQVALSSAGIIPRLMTGIPSAAYSDDYQSRNGMHFPAGYDTNLFVAGNYNYNTAQFVGAAVSGTPPTPLGVYEFILNNNLGTTYGNGVMGSSATYALDGTNGRGVGIGNGWTGGGFNTFGNAAPINAWVAEFVLYNVTLTTAQRQNVEGYLAWKWGTVNSLPANHPYKLFPPK